MGDAKKPGWGAFLPRFNIPETFGAALSYEGQLHWFLENWDQVADYANNLEQPTVTVGKTEFPDTSNALSPSIVNSGTDINAVLDFTYPVIRTRFADPLQWDFDTAYDVLTVVSDGNGNSYTSRQAVPAHTPLTDTDYWVLTGVYDASLQAIREDLAQVKSDYARVYPTTANMQADTTLIVGMICHTLGFHSVGDGGAAWYVVGSGTPDGMGVLQLATNDVASIVTGGTVSPEMYGAYGDGTHDDTSVIEHLVIENMTIVGLGNYRLSNAKIGLDTVPETLPRRKTNISLLGIVSDAASAVCLSGCTDLSFGHIVNTVGDGITFTGNTYDSNICGTKIIAAGNGICYNSETHNCWVQYSVFNIRQIVADLDAMHVYGTDRWFNSNRFENCVFSGGNVGIYMSRTGTGAMDENTFDGISVEGSANGMYFNRVTRTRVSSCRTQEVTNGYRLKLVGSCMFCNFDINTATLGQIDLSEAVGGYGTSIKGVITNSATGDALFNEISINAVNLTQLSNYYSNIVYHKVSQLESGFIWPDQNGEMFNYSNNSTELLNNPYNKSEFAVSNIYVDYRGNSNINFNSAILKYLGTLHLFSDLQDTDEFTTPVTISIDGVAVKTLKRPCSFRFVNDYRKVLIL